MSDPSNTAPLLPQKPDDRLKIKFSGEDRELFMSFQRLNSLLRNVDDPRQILNIAVDPDLGEAVLRVALAPTSDPGSAFEFTLVDDMVSNEDVERILDWSMDHLTYFFMKRFQKVATRAAELEPIAMALASSQAGLAPLISPTAVAGPSA